MNLILKQVNGKSYLTAKIPVVLKLSDDRFGALGGCFLENGELVTNVMVDYEFPDNFSKSATSFLQVKSGRDVKLDLSDPVTKEFHDLAVKMLTPKVELGITLNNFMEIFSEFAKNGVNDKEKIPDFLDSLGYRLKQGE